MADSQVLVKALLEVDPQFEALCDTLFGDAVDPMDVWGYLYTREGVEKMSPAPSDVSIPGAVKPPKPVGLVKPKGLVKPRVGGKRFKRSTEPPKPPMPPAPARPKLSTPTASGRRLNKPSAVPKVQKVGKNSIAGAAAGKAVSGLLSTGRSLKRNKKAIGIGLGTATAANQLPQRGSKGVDKADDGSVTWNVEFSKVDEEKRQVFGWASIVELDGKPIVDRQGDWISPSEIEKAAYTYVQKSRAGGHQHKRGDDGEPFRASDMIESIVFTDEKVSKMGLPDDFPRGWWVGYKVDDEATWEKVKKRDVTGFSIHGRGKRQEVTA